MYFESIIIDTKQIIKFTSFIFFMKQIPFVKGHSQKKIIESMNNRYLYLKYNFDMIINKKVAHELIVFFFDSTRNQKMIITDEKMHITKEAYCMKKEKMRFKLPHTIVVLFCLVVIVTIFTFIIPAGQYAQITNEAGKV